MKSLLTNDLNSNLQSKPAWHCISLIEAVSVLSPRTYLHLHYKECFHSVCLSERERENEREKQTGRQTNRQTKKETFHHMKIRYSLGD